MNVSSRPRGAHLVGSIPLGDVESVFRTVASRLGQFLERMPTVSLATVQFG